MTSLDNPIWSALTSDNQNLGTGTDKAKYFLSDVAPFAAVQEDTFENFQALSDLSAEGQVVVLFSPKDKLNPTPFTIIDKVIGIQMVFQGGAPKSVLDEEAGILTNKDVPEMLALTALAQPGPFLQRTILFGGYHGIFDGDKLVAMGGERLQGDLNTEISAVCTHPDYAGKGYARRLLTQIIRNIIEAGRVPYLHVRSDNTRAIALYARMGFVQRSVMNFYILRK
jgi:ribosomal protein S18 acetylase RimI-like enzyme